MYLDFDLSWHPDLLFAVETLASWSAYCIRDGQAPSRALILAGHPGCGKTHLARLLADNFRDTGGAIQTVNEPRFLAQLRSLYGKKESDDAIFRDLCRAKLLVYDDLGGASGKESWLDDCYYKLFDGLMAQRRAVLITTNLNLGDLSSRLGRRAYSRLMEAVNNDDHFIDLFDVPDYRVRGVLG